MTAIAKLRYMLLSMLVALAFGFAGVAQAETGTNVPADDQAPETIQWDEDEADDEWDWDEEEEEEDEWGDDDWDDEGDEW